METTTIEKDNVLKAFNQADDKGKDLLRTLLPVFFKKKWQEMISWELICEAAGIHPVNDMPYLDPKNDKQEGQNAFHILTTVREVLNEGKDPDLVNDTKYFLWPDVVKDSSHPSGFGLSYGVYAYTYAVTVVGSRLSFNDRAKVRHVWDYFRPAVDKFFLINRK